MSLINNCRSHFMKKYKISVVTICRNCADEIEGTLLSVINQDYSNMEYIVIDGASTDGTVDIIKGYADKIDVWMSEKDKGVYDAMNKGVALATGQWCIFMNGGDKFASDDVISKMFAQRCPKRTSKVYYGDTWERYENGRQALLRAMPAYPTIKRCQPYVHQSAFFNIEDKKTPFYDESYRIISDYVTSLWYYRIYGCSGFEHANVAVSSYKNFAGLSSLAENRKEMMREFLRAWRANQLCWLRYMRESVKYFIIYQQPLKCLKGLMKKYNERKVLENKDSRKLQG